MIQNELGVLLSKMMVVVCIAMAVQATPEAFAANGPDWNKDDPIKIERTSSPYESVFVRVERIEGRILRLALVSVVEKQEVVKFECDNSNGLVHKWEWRDLTGDGKPELLIWYTKDFG